MLPYEVFAGFTVFVTCLWVYLGRKWSFQTLSLAMFFPGLFAPWFVQESGFLRRVIGLDQVNAAVQFSVLGGVIAMGMVTMCIFVNYVTGWGIIDERAQVEDTTHDLLTGFLRAAGEEIGWRCYLLPMLLQHYVTAKALLISGVIWGLFHVPVMLLLVKRLRPPHPYLTVLVQFLSCLLSAFPHGWLAKKGGFSLWPSTMLHYTWNRLNPVVMGSIYTQRPGKVQGQQWLINGEGLAGCIVLLPIAALCLYDLNVKF